MSNEIIAAIIESCGVIIAAVIAALGAGKIVKKSVNSRFHSYADKSHDVKDLLAQSQNDVFVVVASGIRLIENYEWYFIKLFNRGIHIRYLILDENRLKEVDSFIHGEDVDIGYRSQVISKLHEFKNNYNSLFEFREFHSIMTASYICTDIFRPDTKFISSSGIQFMLYQFGTRSQASPITYISPKTDEKEYTTTVQSIKKMWEEATPIKEEE